jgi:hypothetical protein
MTEKAISMDFTTENRLTYLGASPHTLATGMIWIIASAVGQYYSKSQAILIFILAGTFVFPLGEIIRKLLKAPNLLSKENKLPQLFMLLAFTIPMSYPLIYLACKNDVNYFFPAFAILVGAHYLPFFYGYRMAAFIIMAFLLEIQAIICVLYFPGNFSISGYVTGFILLVFAFINYVRVKKESL